ncbi:MAG TPA: PIN domain-containing protein [Candidatus Woesebacteria bacterium]|nr:PIN domain-containing protein [Candidatus Woesebacteria bacterium]
MTFFVDTDILIDLIWHREGWQIVETIFSYAEAKQVALVTTPVVMANYFYVARRKEGSKKAFRSLQNIRRLLKIIPVSQNEVDQALANGVCDFEDYLQYYSALKIKVRGIITRNVKDFPVGRLPVLMPSEALTIIQAKRLRS